MYNTTMPMILGNFFSVSPEGIFFAPFFFSAKISFNGWCCARLRCGCCRKYRRRKSHTQLDIVIFSEKRSTEAALGFCLSFHVNNISPPYLPPYSSHRTIPIPPRNSSRHATLQSVMNTKLSKQRF